MVTIIYIEKIDKFFINSTDSLVAALSEGLSKSDCHTYLLNDECECSDFNKEKMIIYNDNTGNIINCGTISDLINVYGSFNTLISTAINKSQRMISLEYFNNHYSIIKK